MHPLHNEIVERYRKTLGDECTTVRMLEAAAQAEQDMPLFNAHHLQFFRALLAVTQTEAPITEGFSQDQLMEYAGRIGRFNGMLDSTAYIVSLIENQLAPQQQE